MSTQNKGFASVLTSSLALAVIALGVSSNAARAQTDHTTLTLPSVTFTFLAEYVAEDSHLWEKQGLEVKVLNVIGVGAMNAVISNSADFSLSSGTSITRAYARGQKLVALATMIDQAGQDVVIRKDIADDAHFDPTAPLATRAQVLKGPEDRGASHRRDLRIWCCGPWRSPRA